MSLERSGMRAGYAPAILRPKAKALQVSLPINKLQGTTRHRPTMEERAGRNA